MNKLFFTSLLTTLAISAPVHALDLKPVGTFVANHPSAILGVMSAGFFYKAVINTKQVLINHDIDKCKKIKTMVEKGEWSAKDAILDIDTNASKLFYNPTLVRRVISPALTTIANPKRENVIERACYTSLNNLTDSESKLLTDFKPHYDFDSNTFSASTFSIKTKTVKDEFPQWQYRNVYNPPLFFWASIGSMCLSVLCHVL